MSSGMLGVDHESPSEEVSMPLPAKAKNSVLTNRTRWQKIEPEMVCAVQVIASGDVKVLVPDEKSADTAT